MVENVNELNLLNTDLSLDFLHQYNLKFVDNDRETDPYATRIINSAFYNMSSLVNIENVDTIPLYLSVNIQSLNSKFEDLKCQLIHLEQTHVKVDAIAIQETWEICYPDTLKIPGFQEILFKNRIGMRGGGVGFYVRNGLNYKIIEELSPFENKIFESLTIKLEYPRKKDVLLTCAYRSNGIIPGVTSTQQMERFSAGFDELLHNLSRKNLDSYVFMDSNINLLDLGTQSSANFLNSILSKGFLQCTVKATRIQNDSKTLIDNILTNHFLNKDFYPFSRPKILTCL